MATNPYAQALQGAQYPNIQGAQKRSQYLADALKALQESSQSIQSGGELGARLLAQALLQKGRGKADQQLSDAQAADFQRQQALILGGAEAGPQMGADPLAAAQMPGYTPQQAPQQGFAPNSQQSQALQQMIAMGDLEGAKGFKTDLLKQFANPKLDTQVVNGRLLQINPYQAGGVRDNGQFGANLSNVNGTMVDTQNPQNANRFVPNVGEGQELLYNGQGQPQVRQLDGHANAVQNTAQAQSRGTAQGQAPFQDVSVPTPSGAPAVMSRQAFADQGGVFMGQSPAQATQAQAQAQAGLDLPSTIQKIDQTMGVIDGLLTHPAIQDRTGMKALLPALPGTPGQDFDTRAEQLKGQAFLQAFETLKGGGTITEREGQAATQAIARLDRRLAPNDYAGALIELRNIIQTARQRAQSRAGQQQQPASSGWSIVGVQ